MNSAVKAVILFLISLINLCDAKNYCPVTSKYSPNVMLSYPSLYWPERSIESGEEYYNCTVRPKYGPPELGSCMPNRTCIVSLEELVAALGIQTWTPYMNAICSLEEQISKVKNNPNKYFPRYSINVIIIGGSMTEGSGTLGECLCTHSEDSRCPDIDRSAYPSNSCSWSVHFTNWLIAEFPMIEFNVSNLASSGLASIIVPDHIDPYFRRLTFSDNDIIIIDESVNDAGRNFNDLKQDVESMIRRLYSATRGSFPTVIMIEQFPHRSYADGYFKSPTYNTRVLPGDYAIIYRNLSQHYGFVYYSMRELYWTNMNENISSSKRYPFSPFHDWHFNTHPPWYFHNFMADVIADCFLFSLSRCRHRPPSQPFPKYSLPPPYYNLSTDDYCDVSKAYFLDAHPTKFFHPNNLQEYEDGPEARKYGWREYADHHNVSGWIITENSDPAQRLLSFPLDAEGLITSYSSVLIVILFLKSYVGMGIADIVVCGLNSEFYLDGLYKDYSTNRVSMPTMVAYQMNDAQATACQALSAEERKVEILYRPDLGAELKDVRHQNKVKILSVEVCTRAVH